MLTCIDCDTMRCITAENCYDISTKGLVCNDCHCRVVLVLDSRWPAIARDAPSHARFFRHAVPNPDCAYTRRNAATASSETASVTSPPPPLSSDGGAALSGEASNEKWKQAWDSLRPSACIAAEIHEHAVVLQDRDYPDEPAVTVLDGTRAELFAYGSFQYQKLPLFFCTDDGFETAQGTPALVHCSDNRVLQTCSESMVVLLGQRRLRVRFLTAMNEAMRFAMRDYFKGRPWPPRPSEIAKVVHVEGALHVLSVEGRLFIDAVHRDAFKVMPTAPLTVYGAPAGAGKSSALKQAIWAWKNKRVLVVVFNKSNQASLQDELKMRKGCTIRTLDGLVGSVMKCRYKASYEEGMDYEEQERNAVECNDLCENDMEETDPTLDYDDSASADSGEDDTQNDNDDDIAAMKDEAAVDEESDVEFDSNFNDQSFSKKHYKQWDSREQLKHGGGLCAASLIQNRLSHPKAVVHICKQHQRLSLKHPSDNAKPWTGGHDVFPLKRIVDSQSNFAARRFHADKNNMLRPIFDKYDVVMVDERQDLSTAQEMRLLQQLGCPVVAVGDCNQAINSFKDQINTYGCDRRAPCIFPGETTENFPEIPWS